MKASEVIIVYAALTALVLGYGYFQPQNIIWQDSIIGVAGYSQVMDHSITKKCEYADDFGLAVFNTPQQSVLNSQRSYVRLVNEIGITTLPVKHSEVFPVKWLSTLDDPMSREYRNVFIVAAAGDVSGRDYQCSITYHLDFTGITEATTTTTIPVIPSYGNPLQWLLDFVQGLIDSFWRGFNNA